MIKQTHKAILFISVFVCAHTMLKAQTNTFIENQNLNPLRNFHVITGANSYPFFIDIDGDGNDDCFVGELNKSSLADARIYFLHNDGTNQNPHFTPVAGDANPLHEVAVRGMTIPFFVDIDHDGDYDCFIGDNYSGGLRFYKNVGSSAHPVFEKQSAAMNPLHLVQFYSSYIAYTAFADVDGDGDDDCLVSDADGNEFYFRNNGTSTSPSFEYITGAMDPFYFLNDKKIAAPSFFDWNNDGLIDLFIGTKLYLNKGSALSPVFAAASKDTPEFSSTPNGFAINWLHFGGKLAAASGSTNGSIAYFTTAITHTDVIANVVKNIRVYPNPSKTEFVVQLPGDLSRVSIRVTDIQGRVLMEQQTTNAIQHFGNDLQKGTYVLQVLQGSNILYTQKLVKQ